jgi:hypothetical protein
MIMMIMQTLARQTTVQETRPDMHSHRSALHALTLTGASVAFGLTLIPPSEAGTPWAMLARRAIGRVEQLSQAQKGDQPGFDMATVILNADAAKVYATAVGMLRKNQAVHVVAEDAAHRTVEFSNGQRSAGITVTDLGTRLSQLMVGSARLSGQDSATNQVVDGVLRVCQAMKVTCSLR